MQLPFECVGSLSIEQLGGVEMRLPRVFAGA
jgi:hypothetical protein